MAAFTLYTRKNTGGLAVEAALAKAGAAHTLVELDTQSGLFLTPEYLRINPMRQVPAMVLPGGALMTESAAMVMHIANVFPGKGLAPEPGTLGHATFLRWMVFMAVNLYEANLRYFYPARYTAALNGVDGVKSAAAAHFAKSLAIAEQALDPWLTGDQLSIADVYLAMLTAWSPEPLTSAKFKGLCTAVAADPDYGPVWARHGLAA